MPTLPSKSKTKPRKESSQLRAIDRAKAFVEAYMSNGNNAGKAALAAGLSPKSASSAGARMLRSVRVSTLLNKRRAELAEKLELNTETVMRSLVQALHFDPRKLYNADGSLKAVLELDDDTAMCLQAVEVSEAAGGAITGDGQLVPLQTKKIKWLDKNSARDQAARVLGMFKDKVEVGATDDFVKAMLNGRERAAKR